MGGLGNCRCRRVKERVQRRSASGSGHRRDHFVAISSEICANLNLNRHPKSPQHTSRMGHIRCGPSLASSSSQNCLPHILVQMVSCCSTYSLHLNFIKKIKYIKFGLLRNKISIAALYAASLPLRASAMKLRFESNSSLCLYRKEAASRHI